MLKLILVLVICVMCMYIVQLTFQSYMLLTSSGLEYKNAAESCFTVLSQYFSLGTGKNHENSQDRSSGILTNEPRR
jgi:ACR3 family arsenite efflux pump ArsB